METSTAKTLIKAYAPKSWRASECLLTKDSALSTWLGYSYPNAVASLVLYMLIGGHMQMMLSQNTDNKPLHAWPVTVSLGPLRFTN